MLFSLVFANRNLRRSTSLAPAALRPRHIPPRYEKTATATLLFSVSCNSFASHSYENCRVYTNNSHFGLPRGCSKGSPSLPRAQRGAVAAKGTQPPHEQALALTREAKQHTFRHRWNPSPSADEKPITCRGHRCWNDC